MNATYSQGPIDTLVKWDNYFLSNADSEAYVQIEFKDRYIFPTHYSFKG